MLAALTALINALTVVPASVTVYPAESTDDPASVVCTAKLFPLTNAVGTVSPVITVAPNAILSYMVKALVFI